jgi:NAD(P)-dependent dehydrogenase (short-subunit alcohol dehydrogenase family)
MTEVAGSSIVVTGAARGIGRAIAARMAAEGARVAVNDVDGDELAETADAIGAHAVPGDAASTAGVGDLIAEAREHLGRIDVFFANAGISVGEGLQASDDDWSRAFQTNVLAHVRAARMLVPRWLAAGGGRLVITASAAGLLTMLGDATYSASKHAAIGFAEWLSATYRHRGIVVQAICPQGVRTRMLPESGPVEALLTRDAALTPDDVADAVWRALDGEQFLILPHPEVARYYAARAGDPDRWLSAMNKLQRQIEQAAREDV